MMRDLKRDLSYVILIACRNQYTSILLHLGGKKEKETLPNKVNIFKSICN